MAVRLKPGDEPETAMTNETVSYLFPWQPR
jgi:hypothetical protein